MLFPNSIFGGIGGPSDDTRLWYRQPDPQMYNWNPEQNGTVFPIDWGSMFGQAPTSMGSQFQIGGEGADNTSVGSQQLAPIYRPMQPAPTTMTSGDQGGSSTYHGQGYVPSSSQPQEDQPLKFRVSVGGESSSSEGNTSGMNISGLSPEIPSSSQDVAVASSVPSPSPSGSPAISTKGTIQPCGNCKACKYQSSSVAGARGSVQKPPNLYLVRGPRNGNGAMTTTTAGTGTTGKRFSQAALGKKTSATAKRNGNGKK